MGPIKDGREVNEQRYTLASRVLSGGASLFAAQGLAMVVYFLAQRIILSTLTQEQNGLLFAERRMTDLMILMIVDFGLNGIAMRRMIQFPDRAREILSSVAAFRIALWVPASIITLIYASSAGYLLLDVALWSGFLMMTSRAGLLRYNYELPMRSNMRFFIPASVSMQPSKDGTC